jgi:hypothetical protein
MSGSVPATKESPLATSKAMNVPKNVAKIRKNIPVKEEKCRPSGRFVTFWLLLIMT